MLREIILNLVVTAICSVILWSGKKIWVYLSTNQPKPAKYSPKALASNFYVSLIILVVSLIIFCSVPSAYIAVKSVSGLFAGLSFIVVWGAFEESKRFYPGDKVIDSKESKENARENGNN